MGKAVNEYTRAAGAGQGQDSLTKIKMSARKLFLERGYHDTRPQDVACGAGLGHGTFYLHYEDKRACFLDFIEDAHAEFYAFLQDHVRHHQTLEETISHTIRAVLEFSDQNPGLLDAVMTDVTLLCAGGMRHPSALQRWGHEWAQTIRKGMQADSIRADYEPEIVGRAVVAAISQCRAEQELGLSRDVIVTSLARFVTRALVSPTPAAGV